MGLAALTTQGSTPGHIKYLTLPPTFFLYNPLGQYHFVRLASSCPRLFFDYPHGHSLALSSFSSLFGQSLAVEGIGRFETVARRLTRSADCLPAENSKTTFLPPSRQTLPNSKPGREQRVSQLARLLLAEQENGPGQRL